MVFEGFDPDVAFVSVGRVDKVGKSFVGRRTFTYVTSPFFERDIAKVRDQIKKCVLALREFRIILPHGLLCRPDRRSRKFFSLPLHASALRSSRDLREEFQNVNGVLLGCNFEDFIADFQQLTGINGIPILTLVAQHEVLNEIYKPITCEPDIASNFYAAFDIVRRYLGVRELGIQREQYLGASGLLNFNIDRSAQVDDRAGFRFKSDAIL